jgi:cytochrome c oxidase assembly protein subunit 15
MALGIAVMMIIGAITRLTESGLSMTEWNLIGGTPPLNEADWQELFEKYQGTPQHIITFPNMDMEGFKRIFWWEYIHRMFGRGLGLAFILPLVWFAVRKKINWKFSGLLFLALVIGAGQGVLGWYMVQSGLVDRPWVSPVRLTAHFMMATLLLAYVLYLGLALRWIPAASISLQKTSFRWLAIGTVILVVQLILGGMMSGMRAALEYNTFPTMNGAWIPPILWKVELGWMNFLENSTLIQFLHRIFAFIVFLILGGYAWSHVTSADRAIRFLGQATLAVLLVQMTLGILTVLRARGEVPEVLGVLHQVGAILLVAVVVGWWARYYGARLGKSICTATS